MIIEGAFFKIPESIQTIVKNNDYGKLQEDTLRGIFYSALLQELNLRNAPSPGTLLILNKPYPKLKKKGPAHTCDIFLNTHPVFGSEFIHDKWGLESENYIEVKSYRGKPEAATTLRQQLIYTILKLILLPESPYFGRYLLIVSAGHNPNNYLGAIHSKCGEWAKKLMELSGSKITLELPKETNQTQSLFGLNEGFSPTIEFDTLNYKWQRIYKKDVFGMLIQFKNCIIKSQIGTFEMKNQKYYRDIRFKYIQKFNLSSKKGI